MRQVFMLIILLLTIIILAVDVSFMSFFDESTPQSFEDFLKTDTVALALCLILLVFIAVEVTLVKRLRSGLIEKNRSLLLMSAIVDNSPQYIAYINRDGRFYYLNPATTNVTGYSEEELKEHGLWILYDSETQERIREEIIPSLFESGKKDFELTLIRKNGEKRVMAFSSFVIDSEEYSCGTIAKDVTKQKLLEQQLVEAKELAMQNSRAKSDFVSHMSHEIRTPMNSIIGMTKIARETDCLERKNDCLDKIDAASEQLLQVVNDILDISKIEAGKFELFYTSFSLEKMLNKILSIFHFRLKEKNLTFDLQIDDSVPDFIFLDEQRLSQVITNLISNAIKFTPEGKGVSLLVRCISSVDDAYVIEFEVRDDGIGIKSEYHESIFKSYEQADGSIAGKYGGTGLGLPICKSIVEMMGGEIRVESEFGKGANFIFSIKASHGECSADEDDAKFFDLKRSLAGKRILLADDIEINREIIAALLEDTGVEIDCASDGEEALSMFKGNNHYDLILMDIQMPNLNGYEATEQIRALKHDNADSVPIIAMTANVFKEDIERCIAHGMNDHISKPIRVENLLEKLKRYLIAN